MGTLILRFSSSLRLLDLPSAILERILWFLGEDPDSVGCLRIVVSFEVLQPRSEHLLCLLLVFFGTIRALVVYKNMYRWRRRRVENSIPEITGRSSCIFREDR